MKEKQFYFIIIVILLLINAFTLFRYRNFKLQNEKWENTNTILSEIKDDIINTYKNNFKIGIFNNNLSIEDVVIEDSINKIHPINYALDNKKERILVCRFSQRHCQSCVDYTINILQKWVDSIGKSNIVFLGNHMNNRILHSITPLYGIQDLKVYNCPKIDIPIEEIGYPYFFILDSNLHISNVFMPDKASPLIANEYLQNVSKILKSD